ncbi:unnamed protein product [Parnassius apollo]|uniref:(apollo) hypothetical protein n=1 Tax=Parnassius apollo TaxID=110799 RepID=A0A8S3WGI0_PARAO|nr:unnamed protein product [Parnassius apollo]
MYRSIVFLLFVNFASCFWHYERTCGEIGRWRHPWFQPKNDDEDFESLAQCVIAADNFRKNSCAKSTYHRTQVIQGLNFYELKYYLQEFDENSITVKIKYRVLYVTAKKLGTDSFKDLRILPDSLKMTDATWYFEGDVLRVLIPYKNQLKTEVTLTCGDSDHDSSDMTLIDVPKLKDDQIELRFSKEFT